MTETINKILENSRLAYKKSILIDNVELEELLFSIITDSKKLLDKLNDKEKEMINSLKKLIELYQEKINQKIEEVWGE
jgi:hemerythrin superfamily protein